jgi:hypothetical protein
MPASSGQGRAPGVRYLFEGCVRKWVEEPQLRTAPALRLVKDCPRNCRAVLAEFVLIRVTEAIAAGGANLLSSTTWFLVGVLRALQNGIKPMSWISEKRSAFILFINAERLFWELLMALGGAIASSSMFPKLEHGFA